jgi:hypothetical protein
MPGVTGRLSLSRSSLIGLVRLLRAPVAFDIDER